MSASMLPNIAAVAAMSVEATQTKEASGLSKQEEPVTFDEALDKFGEYWVLKDEFDWTFQPPRALSPKARMPIIIRGIAIGVNQAQIAKRCGVARRTIYTDRSSVDAIKLAEELLVLQLEDIGKLARFPDPKAMTLAMTFRDKLLQKLVPRKVETRGTAQRQETGEEVKIPDVSDEDIARYIGVVVKVALEQEARGLDDSDGTEDPEEPVD